MVGKKEKPNGKLLKKVGKEPKLVGKRNKAEAGTRAGVGNFLKMVTIKIANNTLTNFHLPFTGKFKDRVYHQPQTETFIR